MSLFTKILLGMTLFVLSPVLIGATPNVATTSPETPQSKMTEDQAIQRAKDFCQHIGSPVTVEGTAQYPAPPEFDNESDIHWQTRWKVVFPGQAQVQIVDATGIVINYHNSAFYQQMVEERKQPVGAFLTEADALTRAANVLQDIGHPGELLPPKASFHPGGIPATHGGSNWFVHYPRHFQGLAYQEEGLNITLDGETGVVKGLCLYFPSPPQTHGPASVSRDQAMLTAHAAMDKAGLQQAVFIGTRKMMMRPNTFAEPTGNEDPLPGPARPVWGYTFQANTPDSSGRHFVEVWIDTETGAVVGGTMYVKRGGSGNLQRKAKSSAPTTKVSNSQSSKR